jgi:hypothetical protein
MRFIRKNRGRTTVDESGLTKGLILSCFDFTPAEMKRRLQEFFDSQRKSITFRFGKGEVVTIERED